MCTVTEIKESNHIYLLMEQKHKTREKGDREKKNIVIPLCYSELVREQPARKTMQGHYDNYSKSGITLLQYLYKSLIVYMNLDQINSPNNMKLDSMIELLNDKA